MKTEINPINNPSQLQFISYDGKYPNLCSGTLKFKAHGIEYSWNNCLMSGGAADYMDEFIETGEWWLRPSMVDILDESSIILIERMINENIPQGCCGGCINKFK
jgi:hypothetical protein